MKAGKLIQGCFIIIAITAYLLNTSCKKETGYTITNTTQDTATQTIITNDELKINNEFEQVVNEALSATSLFSDSGQKLPPNVLFSALSGALLDTSELKTGKLKITYYGKNSDNTKGRTGEVDVLQTIDNGKVVPWGTRGASVSIAFNQYEVTILKTNVSLWLNGTATVTNVTGGLLKNIADSQLVPTHSLSDKLRATLAFTYNDNVAIIKTWTWNFKQQRAFNLNDTIVTASITGDTSINNSNGIASWGTTRSDQNFYTSIGTPVLENISATGILSNPLSGTKTILGIIEPLNITYGVDEKGNPVNSGIPFGYKITWINTMNQSKEQVVTY